MNEHQACCAHLIVSYRTTEIDGGIVRGHWECDANCGAKFWPNSPGIPPAPALVAQDVAGWLRERANMFGTLAAKMVLNGSADAWEAEHGKR